MNPKLEEGLQVIATRETGACVLRPWGRVSAHLEGFIMTKQTWKSCWKLGYCLLLALVWTYPGKAQDSEHDRKILKKVDAEYPAILKKRGIGGTVRLRVLVKADGSVKDVEVLGGNPSLADAAEKAVKQWKFAPGNDSTINVSVTFDPNS